MSTAMTTEITHLEADSSPAEDKKLETMLKLSSLLSSSLEEAEIREQAISAISTLVSCQAASLLLVNDDTGGLYFDVATGKKGKYIKKIELAKGQGIAGWVAVKGKPIIINNAQNDPRFYRKADDKSGFITKNMVCVPVTNKSKTIGVLQAINKKEKPFSKEDGKLLIALSNQIGTALANARLYDEVKESLYSVVNILASTIEKRDPNAAGHAKRVSRFALAIGKELNLSHAELVNLKLAAVMHDVGMITVPDSILLKKTRLLDEEKEELMTHLESGEAILSEVKQLRKIIPAVKYHHEHYDGSGHFELKGKSIPLFARIIAVADAFDSMTSERPYARCLGYEGARRALVKNSGVLYDPDIVKAFLKSKSFVHIARHFNT